MLRSWGQLLNRRLSARALAPALAFALRLPWGSGKQPSGGRGHLPPLLPNLSAVAGSSRAATPPRCQDRPANGPPRWPLQPGPPIHTVRGEILDLLGEYETKKANREADR